MGGSMHPIQKGSVRGRIILARYETETQKRVRETSARAQLHYSKQEYDKACELYRQVRALAPGHEEANRVIGEIERIRDEEEKRAKEAQRHKKRVLLALYHGSELPADELNLGMELLQKNAGELREDENRIRKLLEDLIEGQISVRTYLDCVLLERTTVQQEADAITSSYTSPLVSVEQTEPEPETEPRLTVTLSPGPVSVEVGGEVKWAVTVRNDGNDQLRDVTVTRDREQLHERFDLATGKTRRFTFVTAYQTAGRKTATVRVSAIGSKGETLHQGAAAEVQVTAPGGERVSPLKDLVDAAKALSMGNKEHSAGNYTSAFELYSQAAEWGHATAMRHLGAMYENGRGVRKDDREAARWYRKGAEAGCAEAMNSLGDMYANGRGVERDEKAAVRWYRKGAEAGCAEAMNSLGDMYANGRGVEQSDKEALAWYRKGAEAGCAEAKYNFGKIHNRMTRRQWGNAGKTAGTEPS